MSGKIEVENVNQPGHIGRVDADKYNAMRDAMLRVMSSEPMTAAQIKDAAKAHLPEDIFPGGATAGWWVKCVQLDLEAKKLLSRHTTKPLTWTKT